MRSEANHRFPSRLILLNKISHCLGDQFRWALFMGSAHGLSCAWNRVLACLVISCLKSAHIPSTLHQRYPYNELQWPRGRSLVHLAVLILCLLFPVTGISQDPGRAIPIVGQTQWQEREEKKKKACCALAFAGFSLWDRISLCSPDWLGIHCRLTLNSEIPLCLSPECWDQDVAHLAAILLLL